MGEALFNNSSIIEWLQYFSEHTDVDLEHVKILDITKKNKNLIPACEVHRCVLVFTEAGHMDIFYRMYNAGLGECTVIYNEGSDPTGPIKQNLVSEMIDRGINASAGMLVLNPKARSTYKFGIDNSTLAKGTVKYVGEEIRSVILSKMHIEEGKNICVISGESIVVESAILDGEGSIIAVEYNGNDRKALEENMEQFGINNVTIIDHVDEETMKGLPVPDVTMLVASASMEREIDTMLKLNPEMEFVIYTLDFKLAASMIDYCKKFCISDPDIIQISVSKVNSRHNYEQQPAPWIISCKAGA
ncbi:MAG: precorrin-6B methylase [Lachnospiraceae bacterium]|nr:precorrin-6B methylase [Lachnospiraceae bacterium]